MSPSDLRFGVHAGQQHATFEEYLEVWRLAEEAGLDWASVFDHFLPIQSDPTGPCFEGFTLLAAMAAHTSRLRCGIIVTGVTYRNPAILAKMATTIDHVSGGRMELGLGAAWYEDEHRQYGVPFPRIGERMDMLDDACRILRALWTQERATVEGRHFSVRDALHEPKPVQDPMPLLIGGSGEKRTLRIVAEHADEWNAHGITVDALRAKRRVLARHCEAVGRDPASIRLSVAGPCVVGESDAAVRRGIDALAEFFPLRAPAFFPDGAATDNSVEAVRARGWFAGRPDEIAEQIQAFADEGVDRVIMQHMPHDGESLELFASTVLPGLARAGV
jgi:F420-dependent oxidoreductase-like protein